MEKGLKVLVKFALAVVFLTIVTAVSLMEKGLKDSHLPNYPILTPSYSSIPDGKGTESTDSGL